MKKNRYELLTESGSGAANSYTLRFIYALYQSTLRSCVPVDLTVHPLPFLLTNFPTLDRVKSASCSSVLID